MQGNLFIEYPAKADVLIYNIIAVAEINNLHLGIYAAIRIRKKFIFQRQYIRMMFFFTYLSFFLQDLQLTSLKGIIKIRGAPIDGCPKCRLVYRKDRSKLVAVAVYSYAFNATMQIVTRKTSVKKSYKVIGKPPFRGRINRLPCRYTSYSKYYT